MSLEYEARAMGICDSQDGKKMLVFRTICGRTVRVVVHTNMADFVFKEINLNPLEESC